jgi:uncharacterized protein YqeY
MKERINNDFISAMKNKEKEKLAVMKMLKGAVQLEELNQKKELSDDEIVMIVAKQIKTRKESIVEFEKGNRTDLIEQANFEIKVLEEYMPEQMSEEEINKVIDEVFTKVNPVGPSDMGKIMGMISPILKGKADLGLVNKLIRDRLNNK